jgi:hypothetical protein
MSALGHKRTFALQKVMSALPAKADMCCAARGVRKGPKELARRALPETCGDFRVLAMKLLNISNQSNWTVAETAARKADEATKLSTLT